ncbi:glycosyltransferase family 4 protein [Candidatus Saccharibacteria bacterium]|nr:glycosyltransferase family 4 protein [Candidatus Saccharibacteria bacterium]
MLGWELPPHHTGGMGVVCLQLCKALSKQNVDIEFILPFTADFPEIDFMKINPALPHNVYEVLFNAGGSTYDNQLFTYIHKDGTTRGVKMIEHQNAYVEYVTKLVKFGEYDIVHAHDWLTFRAGLAAKMLSGKPLILHVHATEYDRCGGSSNGNPLIKDIEFLGFSMADRIIAISQRIKNTIVREYGIDSSKIEIVHNAMEFQEHELNEPGGSIYRYLEYMKSSGYRVVLSAGRLTIQKGLTYLMQTAKLVIERDPKVLFVFVGGGEQYNELIQMSADLGISKNVIMVGHLNGTGRAWRDAFRSADLFVLPSVSEPFGITPIEAITYGSPVIISKQSGIAELLHNCFKTDFWDTNEMANQIYSLLNYRGLSETMFNNSRIELRNISWNKSAQKLVGVYNNHMCGVGA